MEEYATKMEEYRTSHQQWKAWRKAQVCKASLSITAVGLPREGLGRQTPEAGGGTLDQQATPRAPSDSFVREAQKGLIG
jgi:hypothetical protein